MSNIVFSNVVKKLLDDFGQYGNSTVTGLPFYCDKVVVQKWLTEHNITSISADDVISTLCKNTTPHLFRPPSPVQINSPTNAIDDAIIEQHKDECGCDIVCWKKYVPPELAHKILGLGGCIDKWKDARTWYERLPTAFTREGLRNWVAYTFGVKLSAKNLKKLIKQLLSVPIIYLVHDDKEWYVKVKPPKDTTKHDPHKTKLYQSAHFLKRFTIYYKDNSAYSFYLVCLGEKYYDIMPFNHNTKNDDIVQWIAQHDDGSKHIFFTPNPRNILKCPDMKTHGGDNCVTSANVYFVDIDPTPTGVCVNCGDKSMYNEEYGIEAHKEGQIWRTPPIKQILSDVPLPKPDVIVMSGEGYHFYWFGKPVAPDKWMAREKLLVDIIAKAVEKIGYGKVDKQVSNIGRLLRVPNTTNPKVGSKAMILHEGDIK